MPAGYYEVTVIYKAGFSTRVYAKNKAEAKAKAISEVEMRGDHLETLDVDVSADWEPKALIRRCATRPLTTEHNPPPARRGRKGVGE